MNRVIELHEKAGDEHWSLEAHAQVTQDISTGFNRWVYHSPYRLHSLGWTRDTVDMTYLSDSKLYDTYLDTL